MNEVLYQNYKCFLREGTYKKLKKANDKFKKLGFQIKIWDACGQERLRALTANYYRNADGIMLLFDLTQISNFNNLQNWIESVQEKTSFL